MLWKLSKEDGWYLQKLPKYYIHIFGSVAYLDSILVLDKKVDPIETPYPYFTQVEISEFSSRLSILTPLHWNLQILFRKSVDLTENR